MPQFAVHRNINAVLVSAANDLNAVRCFVYGLRCGAIYEELRQFLCGLNTGLRIFQRLRRE